MKYEHGRVLIGAGLMEDILNTGLRVLVFDESAGPGEGESFRLVETNNDEPTGRHFFARVMHAPDPQAIQFDLQPFMEDVNSETGKPERMPMAGEFGNEKTVAPEGESEWTCKVKGEKPVWVYNGIKWVAEYSVAELTFDEAAMTNFRGNKPGFPIEIRLKVQGQGGETYRTYRLQ